ncbi:MAG: hypothetical protein HY762_05830 [Planctomycetes bacterium]|nr:hypothetical protein [Planctomycetota bacterium]
MKSDIIVLNAPPFLKDETMFTTIKHIFWDGLIDIFKTALKVIATPNRFYQEIPQTNNLKGLIKPLAFMVIMLFIGLELLFVVEVAWSFIYGYYGLKDIPFILMVFVSSPYDIIHTGGNDLLFGLIGLTIVVSTILFIPWKICGSKQSYITSFRAVAYTTALVAIWFPAGFIIPLGPFFAGFIYVAGPPVIIWEIYLLRVISKQLHHLGNASSLIVSIIGGVIISVAVLSAYSYWLSTIPSHMF